MSDQNTPTGRGDAGAEGHLGGEVFRCRPLPPMQWVAAQGLGVLGAYVAMPMMILPFFALWPAVGAVSLVEDAPAWLRRAVFFSSFALAYVPLVWLVYLQPRGDHLVVYRKGLRLKITFKYREVLFGELSAITFGLESALVDAATGALRWVRPGQAAMIQDQAGAAMTLHYKDGRKTTFKSFLFRFEPEDTQRFLDYLAEHHPELCQGGIVST